MPIQPVDSQKRTLPMDLRTVVARSLILLLTFGVTSYACLLLADSFGDSKWTLVSVLYLVLFGVLFLWISFPAACALTAVFLRPVRRTVPPHSRLNSLNALVVPLYHEDPQEVGVRVRAMMDDLMRAGGTGFFEIFILSDSQNHETFDEELKVWSQLQTWGAGRIPVWYRRRQQNTGKKAGNVADFVRRWGGRYDHMVVLDADSLMSAATLRSLVLKMQADPNLAVLQTVPILSGATNLFARYQQFSSRLYGPVCAEGLALWSGSQGNYWGHNAILRVSAFAESCGLPTFLGSAPFGGPILSHDFVEAAFLVRQGWKVELDLDLQGSWEASPPTLVDTAVRDRRWAQGNLQHARLLFRRGLSAISRVHLLSGILSYVSSPLWLVFILLSFGVDPQWGPHLALLGALTFGLLLVPKIVGLVRVLVMPSRARPFGGRVRVFISAVLEQVLSVLLAPVMMLIHSTHVAGILMGRDSGWGRQRRSATTSQWGAIWAYHRGHVAVGLGLWAAAQILDPTILMALGLVILGMLAAPLSSWFTSSSRVGQRAQKSGLFLVPEESCRPAIFVLLDHDSTPDVNLPLAR